MRCSMRGHRRRAFSWQEILIVVAVLGIAAAVIGPRYGRAQWVPPDQPEHLLIGRLKLLRAAIATYAEEHGGRFPDAQSVESQLLQYTDSSGQVSPVRTSRHHLGPYLQQLPAMPMGTRRGLCRIGILPAGSADPVGWLYAPATGDLRANAKPGEADTDGFEYRGY